MQTTVVLEGTGRASRPKPVRVLLFILLTLVISMANAQDRGIIGEVQEDGSPVVYKLVNELPAAEIRKQFGWLTVVAWKYDESSRNGMPPADTNARMLDLEHVLDRLESRQLCRHAYSRTGNNLKEFAYYISDRDQFMEAFNSALRNDPVYPVEITFFDDPEWEDFRAILQMFERAKSPLGSP